MDEHAALRSAAEAMGLALTADATDRLLGYRDLIAKWNRVYNLTAVQAAGEMRSRHLLDSLSIARFIDRAPVLDVGSGAGLPGIPLAIALPTVPFTLLDTAAKRTRFMTQAVAELGLANVEIVTARIETLDPARLFGLITSRAFSSLPDFVRFTERHLAVGGRLLAMKGQLRDDELRGVKGAWKVEVRDLDYPDRNGERHAVILSRPAP